MSTTAPPATANASPSDQPTTTFSFEPPALPTVDTAVSAVQTFVRDYIFDYEAWLEERAAWDEESDLEFEEDEDDFDFDEDDEYDNNNNSHDLNQNATLSSGLNNNNNNQKTQHATGTAGRSARNNTSAQPHNLAVPAAWGQQGAPTSPQDIYAPYDTTDDELFHPLTVLAILGTTYYIITRTWNFIKPLLRETPITTQVVMGLDGRPTVQRIVDPDGTRMLQLEHQLERLLWLPAGTIEHQDEKGNLIGYTPDYKMSLPSPYAIHEGETISETNGLLRFKMKLPKMDG